MFRLDAPLDLAESWERELSGHLERDLQRNGCSFVNTVMLILIIVAT